MEQQSSCFPYWLRPQICEMFTNYNSHNEHRKAAGFAATRCGQAVVATSLPEGRSLRRENLQVVYLWQRSSSIRLFACHGGLVVSMLWWFLAANTVHSQKYFSNLCRQLALSFLGCLTRHQYKRYKFRFIWLIQRLDFCSVK